jgi:hypothetical protein
MLMPFPKYAAPLVLALAPVIAGGAARREARS